MKRLSLVLFLATALSGCSSLRDLETRPLANKVPYVGFQPVTHPGQSIGYLEQKDCQSWLFGFIPLNGTPTFDRLKDRMIAENQIMYMTDVSTAQMGQQVMAWRQNCIYIKGVAFR